MSFPRYPKYKPSGVPWLGDVPLHWELRSLKSVLAERIEMNDPIKTEQLLSLTMERGVILYSERSGGGNKAKEDLTAYKLAYPNDIVVNSMNVVAGAVGVSRYFGAVSPVYYMLYPRNRDDSVAYFDSIFQAESFQKSLFGLGNGILVKLSESSGKLNTIRMRIPMGKLNAVVLPYPTRDEQTKIASFLDRETAMIDGLVGEQRRLIELLKEKRQAVISHAVTKGLNPHAPRKPSGIEWLGDVPEHWEMARVKFASHRISKGDTPSNFGMDFAVDGPVRFIKIENIGEGELIETPRYSIDFAAHDQLTRSQLQADDIVFAIAGATTGKCAIIRPEHLPANTNQAVAYIRPNPRVTPPFLVTWLQNPRLQEAMWEMTSQSAQPNLSMENLGNLPIPIPPKAEQEEIVRHVDKIGGGYLKLTAEAERGIELLQERRTALISAAVTGKIDVRGLASDHQESLK